MKNISFRKLTTVAAVGWGIIPLHAQDNLTVDGNLIVNRSGFNSPKLASYLQF